MIVVRDALAAEEHKSAVGPARPAPRGRLEVHGARACHPTSRAVDIAVEIADEVDSQQAIAEATKAHPCCCLGSALPYLGTGAGCWETGSELPLCRVLFQGFCS